MIELVMRALREPWVVGAIGVVILVIACLRVIDQYERGLVFRLGRVRGVKGPGLMVLLPLIDRLRRVDLRLISVDVARQETMTRDNVPVIVDAVIYYRVVDPEKAILEVENAHQSTYLIAQTSLRSVIGQASLDELLQQRDQVNSMLRNFVDQQTLPWGVEVPIVEVKDVSIPETMKRAMAREAEVERERRARLIQALGEAQAAEQLIVAAKILAEVPEAMHLRTLQALSEASQGRGKTVVLPLPAEYLMTLTRDRAMREAPGGSTQPSAAPPALSPTEEAAFLAQRGVASRALGDAPAASALPLDVPPSSGARSAGFDRPRTAPIEGVSLPPPPEPEPDAASIGDLADQLAGESFEPTFESSET